MDIKSFLRGSSTSIPSTADTTSEFGNSEGDEREYFLPPANKKAKVRYHNTTSSRKYQKKWETDFPWVEYDADCGSAFCKTCKQFGKSLEQTAAAWTTKPFTNWICGKKLFSHEAHHNSIEKLFE